MITVPSCASGMYAALMAASPRMIVGNRSKISMRIPLSRYSCYPPEPVDRASTSLARIRLFYSTGV